MKVKQLIGPVSAAVIIMSALLIPSSANAKVLSPTFEICDNNGTSSLCLNDKGGNPLIGNPVIAWSAGDDNNDYQNFPLTKACGFGFVTTNCPFNIGSGLNLRYQGQPIEELLGGNQTQGLCVGINADGGFTQDTICPINDGSQGGFGTVWVVPDINNPNLAPYGVINVAWTNSAFANSEAWMCVVLKGHALQMSETRAAHVCYFRFFFHG